MEEQIPFDLGGDVEWHYDADLDRRYAWAGRVRFSYTEHYVSQGKRRVIMAYRLCDGKETRMGSFTSQLQARITLSKYVENRRKELKDMP